MNWRDKARWWLTGAGVGGMGSCLMGTEFQFRKMKRGLEIQQCEFNTTKLSS